MKHLRIDKKTYDKIRTYAKEHGDIATSAGLRFLIQDYEAMRNEQRNTSTVSV